MGVSHWGEGKTTKGRREQDNCSSCCMEGEAGILGARNRDVDTEITKMLSLIFCILECCYVSPNVRRGSLH